jgi:enoyl-CoA hydratase/carnithine racemase
MAQALDQGLLRDLSEAKAALARHGIVIIRAIETDLEPALMAAAKSSMAASSNKLSKMDDDELDKFSEKIRKTSQKSAEELMDLYVHLMTRLGTENCVNLAKELEGIGQLFKWE